MCLAHSTLRGRTLPYRKGFASYVARRSVKRTEQSHGPKGAPVVDRKLRENALGWTRTVAAKVAEARAEMKSGRSACVKSALRATFGRSAPPEVWEACLEALSLGEGATERD